MEKLINESCNTLRKDHYNGMCSSRKMRDRVNILEKSIRKSQRHRRKKEKNHRLVRAVYNINS